MKVKITFEATVDMVDPAYLENFILDDITLGIVNNDPNPQVITAGVMSVSEMRIHGECDGDSMFNCTPDHHLISYDDYDICAYCNTPLNSILKAL